MTYEIEISRDGYNGVSLVETDADGNFQDGDFRHRFTYAGERASNGDAEYQAFVPPHMADVVA